MLNSRADHRRLPALGLIWSSALIAAWACGDGKDASSDPASASPGNFPSGAGGDLTEPDGTMGAPAFASRSVEEVARETRLTRLTHRQYEHTIQDLFGIQEELDLTFAPDALNGFGYDTSNDFRVDARLGPQYRAMAEGLAERAVTDAAVFGRIVSCEVTQPSCADEFIASFGERAFRRPLDAAEASSFRALFDLAGGLLGSGDAFKDGVQLSVEAMLQSPQFLYRTDASVQPSADGRILLSDFEVASRLSYFLYDSMPDAELFEAARSGQLHTAEQIEGAARRMLTEPRVLDKLVSFHEQAWQFGRFSRISPDRATYPNVPNGFVSSVRLSAELFVEDVIANGGGLTELLTSPYAFVDAGLAPLYGLSAPTSPGYQRIDFSGNERRGLLMQVGFLASNAYSIRTDPIHRGLFVIRDLLCRQVPDPPPGAAQTPLPETDEPIETTREEISLLTGQSYCPTCHSQINPPGFAFEGFDAVGQVRPTENGVAVDTAATMLLDGAQVSFAGPTALVDLLSRSEEAHLCYASRWIEFAHGRRLAEEDVPVWERIGSESLPIADIVAALVTSPQFSSLSAAAGVAGPAPTETP